MALIFWFIKTSFSFDFLLERSTYRKFFYSGLIFILFFLSPGFSEDEKSSTVKFAVFEALPLISIGTDGQAEGLFVDVLEAVARNEGWEIEYIDGTFSEGIDRVKSGEVDLMGAVMHMKDRESFLDFTENSILNIWGQVYVGLDSSISMIFDLNGKTVGIMKGGAHGSNFMKLAEKFGIDCEFREYGDFADITDAVLSGEVAAGVYANFHGQKYAQEGILKQTSIIFNPTKLKFATGKGKNAHLIKAIDTYYNKWKSDSNSEYYDILDKWFAFNTKEVLPGWVFKVIFGVGGVLVIVTVLVFVFKNQVKVRTEALLDSREQHKRIVDSLINTFLYRHDTEGVFSYISPSATQVLGYSADEFLTHYTKYMTNDPINQDAIKCKEESINGIQQAAYELQVLHKDKSTRWLHVSETPVFGKDGKVFAVEGVSHDITDLKNAEIEILAREQQLRAAIQQLAVTEQERAELIKTLEFKNKELQDIVYTASHDLKSPLVNLAGFSGHLSMSCENLEELMKSIDDESNQLKMKETIEKEIPESLGFITSSVVKMKSLIDGLLRISRIGTVAINADTVDMNELLGQVRGPLEFQLQESEFHFDVRNLPDCRGDKELLNQVFTNLIDNAIKYREPSRDMVIEVSGKVDGGEAIYCVKDNGIGVDMNFQGKIFEIFHRLNPDGDILGEGLGLTIVTRIVDRLGGRIWMESEEGAGCEFYVALPIK